MNFADRLQESIARLDSPCLLGLDPHLDLLPEPFAVARDPAAPRADRARALADFTVELIDVARGRVAAVKPQSAFFELFGADGAQAWELVVRAAHEADLLVIGDLKRGDIGSTASAYARAYLEGDGSPDRAHLCDAITINPYLGRDSLEPFLSACQRVGAGLYVLVRTSNPGSADFQQHGQPPLFEQVARCISRWGEELRGAGGLSALGAVVGATHPELLGSLRALMPHTPFLLPGYGAQGAGAADVVAAFLPADPPGRGVLISASRSVAFAYRQERHANKSWKDAAQSALDEMIADVRAVIPHTR